MNKIQIKSADDLKFGDVLRFGGVDYEYLPRNGVARNPTSPNAGKLQFLSKNADEIFFSKSEVEDLIVKGFFGRPVLVPLVMVQAREIFHNSEADSLTDDTPSFIQKRAKETDEPFTDTQYKTRSARPQ